MRCGGTREAVYTGHSNDAHLRNLGSSGGVLTALCLHLLETERVDGIIQTCASEASAIETRTIISRTESDVIGCAGSRYAASAPLKEIGQIIQKGERYAFVGKPCDVAALKAYMETDLELKEHIVILLSFFCAGVPSRDANRRLLQKLGCDEENCKALRYRGDGWPGFATAVFNDGCSNRLSYVESWGEILGRDVRRSCRFCLDGIGEAADISCGDAWQLNRDGTPDFAEHEGRNVIFCRTPTGKEICEEAADKGVLCIEKFGDCEAQLSKMQKYQLQRRATMRHMIWALKLFDRPAPLYDGEHLKCYSKHADCRTKIKKFLGTAKRIIEGRI